MHFSKEGVISIADLVVYIPGIILAILVCSRHGLHRSSGWIYILILCLIRIIGAICQLVTYTNYSKGLLQTTLTLDSIGLSPLLFASLGLLSRLTDWVISEGGKGLDIKLFRVIQLVITVAVILNIAGASGSSTPTSDDNTPEPATTVQIGTILYLVSFVACSFVFLCTAGQRSFVPRQERRILLVLLLAWPFLLVRLAYTVISVFVHDHTFSVIGGSVIVRACMATVEEYIITILYLSLGFLVKRLTPDQQGPTAHRNWKGGNGTGTNIGGGSGRRAGRDQYWSNEEYSYGGQGEQDSGYFKPSQKPQGHASQPFAPSYEYERQ